jgi:hypothetical protein
MPTSIYFSRCDERYRNLEMKLLEGAGTREKEPVADEGKAGTEVAAERY